MGATGGGNRFFDRALAVGQCDCWPTFVAVARFYCKERCVGTNSALCAVLICPNTPFNKRAEDSYCLTKKTGVQFDPENLYSSELGDTKMKCDIISICGPLMSAGKRTCG